MKILKIIDQIAAIAFMTALGMVVSSVGWLILDIESAPWRLFCIGMYIAIVSTTIGTITDHKLRKDKVTKD